MTASSTSRAVAMTGAAATWAPGCRSGDSDAPSLPDEARPDPTVRLLSGVREAAADGSVPASLSVDAEGLGSATVVARGNARRRTAAAEPRRTILPLSGQLAMLTSARWHVTVAVDAADPGTDAEPGRAVLVTATRAG